MDIERYEWAFESPQRMITIGSLYLPTGGIVSCDPFFAASAAPFARSVIPGRYDVQLSISDSPQFGKRVAMARLVFKEAAEAATLEPAVTEADGSSAYMVDSGTGSFMDESARQALVEIFTEFYRLHSQGNYYTDVLAAEFQRNALDPADPNDAGAWTIHQLPGPGLSVAMFASGLGDGMYQTFWALDGVGGPVSLVTDFNIV